MGHNTGELDEDLRAGSGALDTIEVRSGALNEGAEPGEGAGRFADAVSCESCFDGVRVEVVTAAGGVYEGLVSAVVGRL